VNLTQGLNAYFIVVILNACFLPVGDLMARTDHNPKKLLGGFAAVFLGMQFAATFFQDFWAYTFFYGISFGVIHGCLFMYSIRLAQQFYPRKRYLV
jgi:hypothetical protein